MTKHNYRMLTAALAFVLLSAFANAESAKAGMGWLNVRDFGAKGDGSTDDTEAIQKAFNAITGFNEKYPGTAYYTALTPVVFPSGKYMISDTIHIPNNIVVRGEGAAIHQTNPEKDIFEYANAWRMTFDGLTFLGGRHHLKLTNPNLDTGMIIIENCKFYDSAEASLFIHIQSTVVNIRDCIWLQCMQVLVFENGDQAIMRDCWITSHPAMKDKAVIEHKAGRLTIENLCGVPLVNGTDQRWIDNKSQWLSLVRCRFGGEGGGFTPVVNFTKPTGWPLGTLIMIEDSLICSVGNKKRQCAVYCEEIPNSIIIKGCNTYTAEILVSPKINLATYFSNIPRRMLNFVIEDNCNAFGGKRVDLLGKFRAR